jgi:hypothetical protein
VSKQSVKLFLEICNLPEGAPGEVRDYVSEIAHTHLDDFSSAASGYFTQETLRSITQCAAEKMRARLNGGARDRSEAQREWLALVKDFHSTNHWGFATQVAPEKIVKPPSGAKTAAKYLFIFFNSVIVIKTVILFVGAEAAENPDPKYSYILWGAIAFSFLNLFWFAYMAYRKDEQSKRR